MLCPLELPLPPVPPEEVKIPMALSVAGPGDAVGDEPVLFLEPDHCVPGFGAVNPIHPVVQIAPVFQLGLDLPDFLALGADFGQGGIGAVPGARQHGDDQDV